MAVKAIPDGYHSVTPYLIVNGAARAIEFYKRAFGATERARLDGPGGRIGHAEVMIGDSVIMLADEHPEMGVVGPGTERRSPVGIGLYVENADATFARAVECGAKVQRPMADQFYGDRSGTVIDPFGHVWTIATHTQDVSWDEMNRRYAEMTKKPAGASK